MSVYFITCRPLGVVKIGHARNARARLSNIRVCCPFDVELQLTLEGGETEEKAIHAQLAEHRIRGEWFWITPVVEALILNPPEPYDRPEFSRQLHELDPHETLERLETEGWLSGRAVPDTIIGEWKRHMRERLIAEKMSELRPKRAA